MAPLHIRKINYIICNVYFFGFLVSLLKGIYNTCAIHTHVNKQANVARILFAGFLGIFSSSINKILLDAQINEYNKKLSTTPNTYDNSQDTRNTTLTATHLHTLQNNHLLALVPRNYRNISQTAHISTSHRYPQSPVTHIVAQQLNVDETYQQIIEQSHTTNFCSQNNHFFSPR